MKKELIQIFPLHLRDGLKTLIFSEDLLEEIRIRVGQPILFLMAGKEMYFHKERRTLQNGADDAYRITVEDLQSMIKFISSYSIYAYEDEIKRGFLTIQGGHRIGLAGQVVMAGEKILSMSHICFLNIRVAKQKRGCAKELIPYLIDRDSVYNTLIVSPPGIGKTTYLRDTIRILSDGSKELAGKQISVIDERSEIAACRQGIPQNDIGRRSDVLDGCLKSQGMLFMLRSMAPQIIAVDEIGTKEDCHALEQALYCGCKIIGTVHAYDVTELTQKPYLRELLEQKMFGRIVMLEKKEGGARGFRVYDGNLTKIC